MHIQKTDSPGKLFFILFQLLFIGVIVSAHPNDVKDGPFMDSLQKQVEKLNLQFAGAFEKGDVPAMTRYYAKDAVSMPEHHQALYKPGAIAGYYKRWLAATTNNRYQRTIYSIKLAEGYLLEAGTFIHDFTQTGQQPFRYVGKYMHVWRIGKKQELTLVSEIWGAASGFDRASLPLSAEAGPLVQLSPVKPAYKHLADSVNNCNAKVAQLVKERNGPAFSAYYTDDAIYMPYYMPMVIGKDSIHQYYVAHEDPAVAIDSVKINMSRILPAGDYVLVNGFYHVDWRAGEHSGRVTGKSINVWKREQGGKLRLFWQMTNHD